MNPSRRLLACLGLVLVGTPIVLACTGVNSFNVDEDGDGFSNADEIANGTDPCNAADHPHDWDGDHISDLLDPDDDNDGIPDIQDPFPIDPTNGRSVPMPAHYDFVNKSGTGFQGAGFTGVMMNRGEDYLKRITANNVVADSASGRFTLSKVGPGTPRGSDNTQNDAYQFGFNSDEFTSPFVINSRLAGPFFGNAPTGNQTQGIYLGYGDQDNYVSVAVHANNGAGAIEVVYEVGGTITFDQLFPLAGLTSLSSIDLSFAVDPVAGSVQPRYTLAGSGPVAVGSPILVGGDVLMALMGKYPLAIGLFANTGGGPTFSASWSSFDITPQPSSGVAKFTVNPSGGSTIATSSTYYSSSFVLKNASSNGPQIDSATLDLSTSIFPDMVFDVTGTAGDNVFKVFTPNQSSAVISLKAGVMIQPHNGKDADDGYDAIRLDFNAFPHGATFSFSIDIDPNNVKGVPAPGEKDAASISGLELIGATVTVYFHDGTVQRTRLGWLENTFSGSYGWARSDKPPKPGIGIVGQTSPFKSGQSQQVVRVSGPAGYHVSVVTIESALYLVGVPNGGYHVHPYDANTALKYNLTTATIGTAGFVDIPVVLTKTDSESGYNFINATLTNAAGITGPSSDKLEIQYDPSFGGADTQPPTQPGSLTFSNVTSNAATINWTSSSDNVGVTGYRVSRDGVLLGTVTSLSYADSGLSSSTSYTYAVVAVDAANNASSPTSGTVATASGSFPSTIRINAGGGAYGDSFGQSWSADTGFNTGTTSSTTIAVKGTPDPTLYQTERDDAPAAPELSYSLNLPNGSYTARLYFAETNPATSGRGLRVFDVNLQGQSAFPGVDIFAQTGGANNALVLQAPVTVTNGNLTIQFIHHVSDPKINAIEIVPAGTGDTLPPTAPTGLATSGVTATSLTLNWSASTDNIAVAGYRVSRGGLTIATVTSTNFSDSGLSPNTTYNYTVTAFDAVGNTAASVPLTVTTPAGTGANFALRINAGGPAYTDSLGNTWVADTGFNTGKTSLDSSNVNGTADPQLFKTLRYDDFTSPELTYALSVPNGNYRVRLYFAETSGSLLGVGRRVFDIDIQAQLAFAKVDIFSQAGGGYKALVLEAPATVVDGMLRIQFIHQVNNPRIEAIEILSAP
jgi:chitodextrinase